MAMGSGSNKMKKNINDVAIQLTDVSKVYELHHYKPTLVEKMFSFSKKNKFTALKNVSLTIKKGEKVGVIGHNGSGKTTFLKVISKIATPTKGKVNSYGKVIALIDLTAGFHPDLTGIENIYLNGMIVGMSREEIDRKIDDIVAFADIGNFIDEPLFTYSEGMKLRLGFSVAVYADPDILILDEGIAAGDEDFRKKSGERIEELFKKDTTIIVVSHWMDYLYKHCQKIYLFEEGKIKMEGGLEVIDSYLKGTAGE